jgi:hypothetical protein
MKKTLLIQSTIDGIRMSIGIKNELLAMFGRGNLQIRMLLEALASVERSFDLYEVELEILLDEKDAAGIKRVGHWLDKRTPAQQALFVYAKDKAATPPTAPVIPTA